MSEYIFTPSANRYAQKQIRNTRVNMSSGLKTDNRYNFRIKRLKHSCFVAFMRHNDGSDKNTDVSVIIGSDVL